MYNCYSDEQVLLAGEMYKEGKSYDEIVESTGILRNSVFSTINKRLGIKARYPRIRSKNTKPCKYTKQNKGEYWNDSKNEQEEVKVSENITIIESTIECKKCYNKNPEGSRFCNRCGSKLDELKEAILLMSMMLDDIRERGYTLDLVGNLETIKEWLEIVHKEGRFI